MIYQQALLLLVFVLFSCAMMVGTHPLSAQISLQLLFHLIIDHLTDFSASPDVFSMFTEQLKKTYFNILIKPEKLGK